MLFPQLRESLPPFPMIAERRAAGSNGTNIDINVERGRGGEVLEYCRQIVRVSQTVPNEQNRNASRDRSFCDQ